MNKIKNGRMGEKEKPVLKGQEGSKKLLTQKKLNVCDKCLMYFQPMPHKNLEVVGSLGVIFFLVYFINKINHL